MAWEHAALRWDQGGEMEARLAGLPADAVVALSSEGALFDYGSDAEITALLRLLRARRPDCPVVGTISRSDGPGGDFNRENLARVVPRSPEAMRALANGTGWKWEQGVERPLFAVFRLS